MTKNNRLLIFCAITLSLFFSLATFSYAAQDLRVFPEELNFDNATSEKTIYLTNKNGYSDLFWSVANTASWLSLKSSSESTVVMKNGRLENPQNLSDTAVYYCSNIWPRPEQPRYFKYLAKGNQDKSYLVDETGQIQVFDADGKLLKKLSLNYGNRLARVFPNEKPIAVDQQGYIYSSGLIGMALSLIKFDAEGRFIASWAAGDISASIEKILFDSQDNIYALRTDAFLSRFLVRFDKNGIPLQAIEINTRLGRDAYRDMIIGAGNNIYIGTDRGVIKLNPQGQLIHYWTYLSHFNKKSGNLDKINLAVDSKGNIYACFSDYNEIQKFDPNGRYLTYWGRRGAQEGELSDPTGIIIGAQDNPCVLDYTNGRIQAFSASARPIKVIVDRNKLYATQNTAALAFSDDRKTTEPAIKVKVSALTINPAVKDTTPPKLDFVYPRPAVTIPHNDLILNVSASDTSGVAEVIIYAYDFGRGINPNQPVITVAKAPAAYNPSTDKWELKITKDRMTPGKYLQLWVSAKDKQDNLSAWQYIAVFVKKDETPIPTVNIKQPLANTWVSNEGFAMEGWFENLSDNAKVAVSIYDLGKGKWIAYKAASGDDRRSKKWNLVITKDKLYRNQILLIYVQAMEFSGSTPKKTLSETKQLSIRVY